LRGKIFARELSTSPAAPRVSAEPSRKIAFTFFDFARARFFLLKGKAIFLRGVPSHGTAAGRSDWNFSEIFAKAVSRI